MKNVLDRMVDWMERNLVIVTVLVYVAGAFVVSWMARLVLNMNL